MKETKKVVRVSGMSCAACSVRIEKALSKDRGVLSSYANFSNNTVSVTFDADRTDEERICAAIEKAGYSVLREGNADRGSDSLLRSLIIAAVFSVPVVILGMGPMFGLDIGIEKRYSAILQLILTVPVVIAGRRFFVKGIPALFSGCPTMDTLIAVGSGTAFAYSAWVTASMAAGGDAHLYYDSAAMIITLVSVGKFLESRSRERTNDAVNGLKHLLPDEATVIEDGRERTVAVDELRIGDVMLIRPGERIPTDGNVIAGSTSADESMLTGESVPVIKGEGDAVLGGTLNTNGSITAEVTAVGDGTVLSGIIRMVEDAQSTKAPVARMADRIAAKFVPAVMAIAVLACIGWIVSGKDLAFGLTVMISVLVISCPCALGLATPLAITVGTGKAAEYGILFKDAPSLEKAGRITVAVLDKTGTVTEGEPSVAYISNEDMLAYAASAEYGSEHPIAKAICAYASSKGIAVPQSFDFISETGFGVRCKADGHDIAVGNADMFHDVSAFSEYAERTASEGSTVVYVSIDSEVSGMIAVRDPPRGESTEAVSLLRTMDVDVEMVTGDGERTAEFIANDVGITSVHSCARPEDKVMHIKRLQAKGEDVAMVGDGINDAPALTQSDLGIAVASGTDIAMDSADVVLMNDDLHSVPYALQIGRATLRNIRQNLFFALCYNAVCIPIAAGLPYLFGASLIESMPMIAAAAMSLSSLSVVTNALRLRRFRPPTPTPYI